MTADGVRRVRLADCLDEVVRGVGPSWKEYRLVGATRDGLAPAKEGVGKSPERYKLVEPGTIFYNPMRILLGSIAILDEGQEPGITSPDYVVFKTCSGVIHPRWFYYWLRSTDGAAFIRTLARGAVRERMLFRRLAAAEVHLPPFEAQSTFARAVGPTERARAAAEAQLEAAQALPAAYLRSIFSGSEVSSWPVRRLGDALRLRKDVVHPRDNPKGPAAFVGLEHIESATGIRTGVLSVEMAELTGRKPRFFKGDIVYGYLRPYLNKVWIAEFDGLCSVDQYVYEVDRSIAEAEFIAAFMRSPLYLESAPVTFTPGQLPRIRTEEVASVPVRLPSLPDQRRLLALLKAQEAHVAAVRRAVETQLMAFGHIQMALLRCAFSGEL